MTGSQVAVVAAFALVGVLLASVEWMARRTALPVPTLGDMCAVAMGYEIGRVPVGRIAVLGFWWWVGWHFFAR